MNNHSFIVRVWLESNPGGSSIWRASVLDSSTQERWYFSSVNRLAAFLFEVGDGKPDDIVKQVLDEVT